MPHGMPYHTGGASGSLDGGVSLASDSRGGPGWLRRFGYFILRLRQKKREPVPADRLLPEQL